MTVLKPKPGFPGERIVWGKPDAPRSSLCSLCFNLVGPVPLLLCAEDGHVAQFCDDCMRKWWGLESYDGEPP